MHCGPSGGGHFVKMVHNGIEYGLSGGLRRGLNILRHADVGKRAGPSMPKRLRRHPEHFRYDFNLATRRSVAPRQRRGVLAARSCGVRPGQDPALAHFSGRVSDSGEGRWTINAAVEEGAPAPVLSAALFQRFSRAARGVRAEDPPALRAEFGGHGEPTAGGGGSSDDGACDSARIPARPNRRSLRHGDLRAGGSHQAQAPAGPSNWRRRACSPSSSPWWVFPAAAIRRGFPQAADWGDQGVRHQPGGAERGTGSCSGFTTWAGTSRILRPTRRWRIA